MTKPVAGWAPQSGSIILNEGLFNDAYLNNHYHWHFLHESYTHMPPELSKQHAIIAHEFGHVLARGLHLEAVGDGFATFSLESRYRDAVPGCQWPHPNFDTNENLATDLGLWALGVERTTDLYVFRNTFLIYTISDTNWPQQVLPNFPGSTSMVSR